MSTLFEDDLLPFCFDKCRWWTDKCRDYGDGLLWRSIIDCSL